MMRRVLAAALAATLLASACSSGATTTPTPAPGATDVASPPPVAAPTPSGTPAPTAPPGASDAALAALGVNEIGRIPVIMWHDTINSDGDTRWNTSLATFRAQLQELCDRGYRPISEDEFASGRIDLPAGRSPVLLTFDDSYKSHLYFDASGQPAADSVVGILDEMTTSCEDWRAEAVFAIYWPWPFREFTRESVVAKVTYLAERGFDFSNHTLGHDNLRGLPDAEVIDNLSSAEAELRTIVPEARFRSLTLTQGIWPDNREVAITGTGNGLTYQHRLIYEVGQMPSRSPNHVDYDALGVERVQSYVPEFRTWIDWLDAEPDRRFISDGDPGTVTYPESFADVAKPQPELQVRVYRR